MSNGIVVDHKESGVRFAVPAENFDEETQEYVRDLRPEETVLGYKPKPTPTKTPEARTAVVKVPDTQTDPVANK